MKGPKYTFVCQGCGYQTPKWLGRCPDCGQWNTFVEEVSDREGPRRRPAVSGHPQTLETISFDLKLRFQTGIDEFDRTLCNQ